jgi:carbamate kinase
MTATAALPGAGPGVARRRPVVVALGDNALLGPGGSAKVDVQRRNVATAVASIADLAGDHDIVVAHRNGRQGMIGYLLEQGLDDALPGRDIATVRMRGVVDAAELRTVRALVAAGVLVVCSGGADRPPVIDAAVTPRGPQTFVDGDVAAALLATCLGADALLMLTDVAGGQPDRGTPVRQPLRRATPDDMRRLPRAAGSMDPKLRAACRFVEATGGVAAIGALADARALLNGRCGTIVQSAEDRLRADSQSARDRLSHVPAAVARAIGAPTAGGISA